MKDNIEAVFKAAAQDRFGHDVQVNLVRPDPKFGDYTTSVAFELAAALKKAPAEIANELAGLVKSDLIKELSVAGGGFINIVLTPAALLQELASASGWPTANRDKLILTEFGDPNPFKEMHLGHLYSSVVGDAIATLLEASGARVKRLSYHGDVGVHIAKCIWAIIRAMDSDPAKLDEVLAAHPLGYYYALGAKAFDDNVDAKAEIIAINQHVYARDDTVINTIYQRGWDISFANFDAVFDMIGVHYDRRYLESESAAIGQAIVEQNTPDVFEKSDGAVVYKGEKAGLHTRVFITSAGLPTYEAKDLGLVELKQRDYPDSERSIVLTANEQAEYFKVMLAALKEINPELAVKTIHMSHGVLGLTTGKMSSRSGDVYAVLTLLDDVKASVSAAYPNTLVGREIFLAAVKYTLLRHKIGSNIVFDVKESVSLEGNSGPYIQYAHARARSILDKYSGELTMPADVELETAERLLIMKINTFPEVVEKAIGEYMPHLICNYLYELAQNFNQFYESNRVINDPRMLLRLDIISKYATVLKSGLNLLSIPAPDRM